jgi:hypothetical protein
MIPLPGMAHKRWRQYPHQPCTCTEIPLVRLHGRCGHHVQVHCLRRQRHRSKCTGYGGGC